MQRNPGLTPAIAPLWAQNLDFPHADKLAQVLLAMAPEPVQAILNPDAAGKPTLEQVMQQNQQLQQTLHMMQEAGAALQQENAAMKADREKEEGELLIKGYAAVTDRMQVLAPAIPPDAVQGIVMQTLQALSQQPVPNPPEAMEPQGMPMGMGEMQQPPPMPPPDMGMQPAQQPQGPLDAGFSHPEAMQ
jgi:hypothetical protein